MDKFQKGVFVEGAQYSTYAKNNLVERVSYNDTIKYLNGYSNKAAYINIYKENKDLIIIVAGTFDIGTGFVTGAIQTPLEFTLDEETSRKLYVGDSNTNKGNIVTLPAVYYNDINYTTLVVPGFIRRVDDNGNTYWIRFGNSGLTSNSKLTDYQLRVTLSLE